MTWYNLSRLSSRWLLKQLVGKRSSHSLQLALSPIQSCHSLLSQIICMYKLMVENEIHVLLNNKNLHRRLSYYMCQYKCIHINVIKNVAEQDAIWDNRPSLHCYTSSKVMSNLNEIVWLIVLYWCLKDFNFTLLKVISVQNF